MKKKKNGYSKLNTILELPEEICSNTPKIFVTGFNEILVQNVKGILEYDEVYISISTYIGVVNMHGSNLTLENMMQETVTIKGFVDTMEFERVE